MRLAFFRVALAVISFAVTLGFGECLVRVVSPQPVSWLAIYQSDPDLPFYRMLPDQRVHIDTGETEWTVSTNDQGFRVPLEPRPATRCAALWLGDSFAFGHGVEYGESFIGQIEQRTPGVRHVNSAVSGYGPIQYRQTLEHLGRSGVDFDWVFVATYLGNDFHDTQWDKEAVVVDGIIGNKTDLKSLLKRNLHVYRLFTSTYHGLAGGGEGAYGPISEQLARPSAWQEDFLVAAHERYATEMRLIQEYATRHRKQVAFLILPTREAAAERAGEAQALGAAAEPESGEPRSMLPVERARSIFEDIGARYIDLTSIVGERPVEESFYRLDGHLTPEANRRVADEFVRQFDLQCDSPDLAPRRAAGDA